MRYWKFSLRADPDTAEILLAYLSEGPFEGFQETSEGLETYVPAHASTLERAETLLTTLQAQFTLEWSREFVPSQDWNALWETNFPPVRVEDFCAVRAPFHPLVEGVVHELVIAPKMAFGTGHHETTWMCLRALRDLPCKGKHLLDFGCGTGILAILAARLGAASVIAVDIEEAAYHNTRENCQVNGVSEQVQVFHGDLRVLPDSVYDGIMANINRNVIVDALPYLAQRLRSTGWLLVSGILTTDEAAVHSIAEQSGLSSRCSYTHGQWTAMILEHP